MEQHNTKAYHLITNFFTGFTNQLSTKITREELRIMLGNNIPREIVKKDIIVPTAPNNVIVMKFRKNCFFFTWNLVRKYCDNLEYTYKNWKAEVSCKRTIKLEGIGTMDSKDPSVSA